MRETVYLIDGSAYIYRAYHAIAPLSNSKGLPTNGVLGFINMIKKLRNDKNPSHQAIAFDSRGKVFRHKLYAEYKANRPPMPDDLSVQIPYIKRYVEASNIRILEQQGVEADDLIASAVKKFSELGFKVVIVSGDKDLLQLVSENVMLWDPMKDKEMDSDKVVEKYGFPPGKLLDVFSLVGDSADNIPGVPGVGLKTAQKLLTEYSTLDSLYENVESLKKSKMKEKIIANRDQAFLSRDLIRLKDDIDIPIDYEKYEVVEPDVEMLSELYNELEFTSLLKGLDSAKKIDQKSFETITDPEKLKEVIQKIHGAGYFVFDTETTSLNSRQAELVGLSIAIDLPDCYYIPIAHQNQDGDLIEGQISQDLVHELVEPLFKSDKLLKIGHNLKYDLSVLQNFWDLSVRGPLADTMIAAYLLETGERSLKLDDLCLNRGLKLTSYEEVIGGEWDRNFSEVAIEAASNYSCEDVYATLVLWKEFKPELEEKGLISLFYDVEMSLIQVLVDMELVGICVDNKVLQTLSDEFSVKLESLKLEIYALAGHEFNINSPQQLGKVLFDEQGLPHGRKTKTGYSTDVKVLEKLASKHQLPALILRYRTVTKLKSTYVDKLSQLIDQESGRIHTSFNQAVTATGRLSSSDPNLQNIPIRTEEGRLIRTAFVSPEKKVFVSADYSQIDLRVLAHYSQDRALLDAFLKNEDVHARTASQLFGVSSLLITSEMRRVAKSINFGIVYGMSSFGLSNQLNISRKDAQKFIDTYFEHYSGVQEFMESIVEEARDKGYVTTLLNRRRSLPEINSKNRVRREFSERMAINTPIQGTAADIIKLAMIECYRVIKEQGMDLTMLLQVHDELVFEMPVSVVDESKELIKKSMENAFSLDVPLVVNLEVGTNLAK